MTCAELRTRLDAYARGVLPPAEAVALEVHLNGCAACSAFLEHAETPPDEREYLVGFRRLLRGWRADKHLRFSARSILLVVRTRPVSGRSAPSLATDKPVRKTLVAPASQFATLGVSRRPR